MPDGTEDADRDLAARRRGLEREFDDKLRDLKAQHKRQADKLQQDRLDWDQHKQAKAKELADREEKARRHEENARKAEGLKAEERKELEALRARVKELDQEKLDAKAVALRSRAKVEKVRSAARSSGRLVPWFAGLSLLGGAMWLATATGSGDASARPLAGAFLLAALALTAVHLRALRRTGG